MLQEFTLNRGRAIINFTSKYCDNRQKVLSSYAFHRVVETFFFKLKKDNQIVYDYFIKDFKTDENLTLSYIEVLKLLSVCELDELLQVNNKYADFFKDKNLFLELTELLYNFWRRMERVTVVHNNRMGDGLQNVRFIQANQLLNELILSIYRRTRDTVNGHSSHVYRQTIAGANAGLMLYDIPWDCPIEYKGLLNIPFIDSVVITPPYITYTKKNTRDGIFKEHFSNPLNNLILNEDDWFLYPAMVGNLLSFVYFHKDFMCHGLGLANLFELAKGENFINKKPDLIYVFGYPDGLEEKRTFYYKDTKNDIIVGYANYTDEIDYFGYMKKMLLTLHNVKQMEKGNLPIHGAMVNIALKNGKEANIIIMGASMRSAGGGAARFFARRSITYHSTKPIAPTSSTSRMMISLERGMGRRLRVFQPKASATMPAAMPAAANRRRLASPSPSSFAPKNAPITMLISRAGAM